MVKKQKNENATRNRSSNFPEAREAAEPLGPTGLDSDSPGKTTKITSSHQIHKGEADVKSVGAQIQFKNNKVKPHWCEYCAYIGKGTKRFTTRSNLLRHRWE